MNENSVSVVSEHPSSRSVWVNFQIELDERLIDNAADDFHNVLIEYSDQIGPELTAKLMEIDKELRFRDAIQSKLKAGGVTLKYAGKNEDGDDVYRVA